MANHTLKEKSVTVEELLEGAKRIGELAEQEAQASREKCNDLRKCCQPHQRNANF